MFEDFQPWTLTFEEYYRQVTVIQITHADRIADPKSREAHRLWINEHVEDPQVIDRSRALYAAELRHAIDEGKEIPEQILSAYPRLKARRTLRRNAAAKRRPIVWATFHSETDIRTTGGYAVRNLSDGPPSAEQQAQIARAVDEVASVVGPCADLFAWSGLRIFHTDGRSAPTDLPVKATGSLNGSYNHRDRIICVGRTVSGRSSVAALGHEWGHWLDYEVGWLAQQPPSARPVPPNSESREPGLPLSTGESTELANDAQALCRQMVILIEHARALMRTPRRRRSGKQHVVQTQGNEIWARAVEQYLAQRLPPASTAVGFECPYCELYYYWSEGAWAEIDAEVGGAIGALLTFFRSAVAQPTDART